MEEAQLMEILAISLSGKPVGARLLKRDLDAAEVAAGLLGDRYAELRSRARKIALETADRGDHILTIRDPDYPEALRRITDPPAAIFLRGDLSLLKPDRFSIVGTRTPSLLSFHWIKEIAQFISSKGLVSVSGMAAGIDEIVHRNSPGGTIAVLAGSLDYIYPETNRDLYERSRRSHSSHNVLLMAENSSRTGIKRYHFTRRNRIIAALGQGVLFAEGGATSGAVITADYARKYGKEIFVLNHPLLKNNDGAKLLLQTGARDISRFFPISVSNEEEQSSFDKTDRLYLGEGRHASVNSGNFSLEFLSPAQQELVFAPQND